MIKRVVKMSFREDTTDDFEAIFRESALAIRQFPGSLHLELWRDRLQKNVYLTYSHWENESALEAYRQSTLFKATWERTKVLFDAKPEARSLDGLAFLP